MATDTLNEANAKVIIFIRDVNDLPPVFDENSYIAHIFEEEIPVNSILQVSFTLFFMNFEIYDYEAIYLVHSSLK